MKMCGVHTVGDLTERFGVTKDQVRRLIYAGRLPEAARIGFWRAWTDADLPQIEAALRTAGYLSDPEPAIAG